MEDETQPESQPAAQQLRSQLLERLDALRLVHPILASTERYIREMDDWTRRHDPESEMVGYYFIDGVSYKSSQNLS